MTDQQLKRPHRRGGHPVVGAWHHHLALGGGVEAAGKFAGGQHVAERGGQQDKKSEQHQRVRKTQRIHGREGSQAGCGGLS
jgi:hypothetical protein